MTTYDYPGADIGRRPDQPEARPQLRWRPPRNLLPQSTTVQSHAAELAEGEDERDAGSEGGGASGPHGDVPRAGELRSIAFELRQGPRSNARARGAHLVKRAIDVIGAGAMLVPLAVIGPIVKLRMLQSDPGPLVFRQVRVGQEGVPFTIFKLRTMYCVPEMGRDGQGRWTEPVDNRVTPHGRVLRRWHLDELPQALNILRGEMSIVGPRPEQLHYARHLAGRIAGYSCRHSVRPGLTGLAQLTLGYVATEEECRAKLAKDLEYIASWNLWLDLKLIALTAVRLSSV